MCKHIINAQVSVRAPCCQKWFDCPQCHAERSNHKLLKTTEMTFACKKCKKVFRKNVDGFEESDEYCPHCDNHYIIEAQEPIPILEVEAEDSRVDSRILRDPRMREKVIEDMIDELMMDKLD